MPSAGEVVAGKFLIDRVIGEGGMGIVYRALHVDLDLPVAVKVVREELARHEEVASRMILEARTAARLRSEHITHVVDVGRLASGAPYIVMECLEGEDLAAFVAREGALSPEPAVSIILQTCEAVAEAHAAGIVHRDLKPENLFLTQRADGSTLVKVLDFGISKSLARQRERSFTNPSAALGSPNYMSPEQMRPGSDVDGRADIWSLGAVLLELVTGTPPFDAETIPAVCSRVINEEPLRPTSIDDTFPARLEAVILKCLRKDPAGRFQTVEELAKALAPFGLPNTLDYVDRIARVAAGPQRPSLPNRSSLSFRPTLSNAVARAATSSTPSVVTDPVRGRAGGRAVWLLAAAILLLGAGAAFMRLRSPDQVSLAEETARAAVQPTAPEPVPQVRAPLTPPAPAAPADSNPAAAAREEPANAPPAATPGAAERRRQKSERRRVAATPAEQAAPPAPAAPPAQASPPAAPPAPPVTGKPRFDDPARFGGRY